jgi:tetratricopeptide (TPR) repeat protein
VMPAPQTAYDSTSTDRFHRPSMQTGWGCAQPATVKRGKVLSLLCLLACIVPGTGSPAAVMPHPPSMYAVSDSLMLKIALEPGRVDHSATTNFAPSSPLVLLVQQLLAELELYRGAVDGRLNDDVEVAVRTLQRRSGMMPDGRIDESLLSRLEFAGQAGRLVGRLDELRSQQQERARKALASTAATRSLFSGAGRLAVADPTRNTESCLSLPTVQCLLIEATEAAKAINRAHFRDWVLGEVVSVQARTGTMSGALATAGLIDDPRLVIVALKRMVMAAAGSDRIETALATAEMIPDAWARTEARISVVSAYLRRGRVGRARGLAALIGKDIVEVEGEHPRVSMLVKLASALIDGGSLSGAVQALNQAILLANLSEKDQKSDAVNPESIDIAAIAAGFARIGRTERARQLLSKLDDETYRESALIDAAYSRALTGDVRGARGFADSIQTPRFHLAALLRIAEAQRDRGRRREAVSVLPDALRASTRIGKDLNYARSDALSRIAILWVGLEETEQAVNLARQISDDRVRAGTMWTIAAVAAPSESGARRLETLASHETGRVASTLDRAWIMANAAATLAALGRSSMARQLFDRGMSVTREMKSPWGRAQALVKFADVLHILERSKIVDGFFLLQPALALCLPCSCGIRLRQSSNPNRVRSRRQPLHGADCADVSVRSGTYCSAYMSRGYF